MAIIIKDENNTRTTPLKVKISETFPGTSISTLPYGFYQGAAVVLNSEVHILGGLDSDDASGVNPKNQHYKYSNGQWIHESFLPDNFYGGSAVVLNNEIHILGGSGNDRHHYKYTNGQWVSVSTLPIILFYGSAVVLNNEIHILMYTSHYKYSNGSWVFVSTLPYKFSQGSAVVLNGEIHILGGNEGYGSPERTNHYKYINNEQRWVSVSTLPTVFYQGAAVVIDDEIHILYHKWHYVYRGDSWTKLGEIPDIYDGSAVVVINIVNGIEYCSIQSIGGFIGLEASYRPHYLVEEIQSKYLPTDFSDSWDHYGGTENIELSYDFTAGSAISYINPNNNKEHILLLGSGYDSDPGGKNLNKVHILGYDENYESEEYGHWTYESRQNLSDISYNQLFIFFNDFIYQIQANKNLKYAGCSSFEYYYPQPIPWNVDPNSVCPLPNIEGTKAIVYRNRIHILGGFNASRAHYSYDGESSQSMYTMWDTEVELPYDFMDGSVVVIGGIMILFGGLQNARKLAIFNGIEWVSYNNVLPFDLVGGYTEILKERVHIFGGTSVNHYSISVSDLLDNLSTPPTNWKQEISLPYISYHGCSAVFKNNIHIFGGINPYGGDHMADHAKDTYIFNTNGIKHLFNKIKDIWTKVKVPIYDQYGNCHIEEQAKKVKAVWVGGPDNKAKRIFY